VDLSSKAAAAYISDLLRYFGSEHSNWTLALLSFNQGEDLTRLQIDKLTMLGLTESNYWVISENRQQFEYYNPSSDSYVRRFFAAAVIGENPQMFGLVTPPLSTIRTRPDLGLQFQNDLVNITAGTFSMGRSDSVLALEKPAHPETVNGFSDEQN
jgi:formylglycine-generating enzyme required for sulfatase activity